MNETTKANAYDYVIVGAGSAGCVLANRLSANPNVRVCLLEAGPEDKSFLIRLPAGILGLMWDPRHNWKYYSEPETHMNSRRMYCPRGKVIGGSSSINAMCFTRGLPSDFDRWGVEGWSWDDLFPHYLATEGQLSSEVNPDFHGFDGEQLVADVRHNTDPMSKAFVNAVVDSGVAPYNGDFNGEKLEGAGFYQTFQNGRSQRCSAAHAFLHPVRERQNLTVVPRAHVTRILFDGKTAVGVQANVKGKSREFLTTKDVILSAGAINSPQLLMLSGVGDERALKKFDIASVKHLPGVGKNLQDHLDVVINTRVKNFKGVGLSLPFIFKGAFQIVQYFFQRKGFLAGNGAEAGGFIRTDPALSEPDIQMHFAPLMLDSHFIRAFGHGVGLHLCNLRPVSRGAITLKSADPRHPPALQFNYGENSEDIDVLVKAVKLGRVILASKGLAEHIKYEQSPGNSIQSDDEIREFVRDKAETIYHPVGTCKMGFDEQAVVDDQLRVHGVDRLRVVDASIMPYVNSGNTHATVIAIADKAASQILSS